MSDTDLHIVPQGDLTPHTESEACACNPIEQRPEQDGVSLWVHQAGDDRDLPDSEWFPTIHTEASW